MARDRIIYQSLGVLTGPTGALPSGASLTGIQRVQSVTHTETINRQDVNQFGQLGRIDSIINTAPTVQLTFEALLVNAINSNRLGLITNGAISCVAGILSGTTDVRNYYLPLSPEGSDLISTTGAGVFGFGNGFISNVTYAAAVGDFPRETYQIDPLNYRIYNISSGVVPTVNPTNGQNFTGINFIIPSVSSGTANSVSALQHGDISLSLSNTLGFAASDLHVQNFNISIPLAREDIQQLGTKFAYAKKVTFPVTVSASFDTIVGDLASGNLADVLCSDNPLDLTIDLREPNCGGTGNIAIRFNLKNAKLDSTNFSSAIGSNSTCTFSYSTQLAGPEDTARGLFLSGISS